MEQSWFTPAQDLPANLWNTKYVLFFFFKLLHFYYPLKGALECSLVKSKIFAVEVHSPKFTVSASVAGVILCPLQAPGPGQRHQWMFRGEWVPSTGTEPAQELLRCSPEHFCRDLPVFEGLRVNNDDIKKLGNEWDFKILVSLWNRRVEKIYNSSIQSQTTLIVFIKNMFSTCVMS